MYVVKLNKLPSIENFKLRQIIENYTNIFMIVYLSISGNFYLFKLNRKMHAE